jgi:hypothetical protein
MKTTKTLRVAVVMAAVLGGFSAGAARAEGRIGERKENQQARIAAGLTSGQLTPGEAARLERREASLNCEERAFRITNGGALTPAERTLINRQQNSLSLARSTASSTTAPDRPVTVRPSIIQRRRDSGGARLADLASDQD